MTGEGGKGMTQSTKKSGLRRWSRPFFFSAAQLSEIRPASKLSNVCRRKGDQVVSLHLRNAFALFVLVAWPAVTLPNDLIGGVVRDRSESMFDALAIGVCIPATPRVASISNPTMTPCPASDLASYTPNLRFLAAPSSRPAAGKGLRGIGEWPEQLIRNRLPAE